MDFEICTPAKFYLFFAFLSLLTAMFYGQSSLFIIVQLVVSIAWVAGLNYLCKAGYVTVSWAVTLVPVWIGIIAYGLTFITILNDQTKNGSGVFTHTSVPTPGDFTNLKAATLTQIINSIFNLFTNQAQFDIKPVFDQVKCNAANARVPSGWGNKSWTATDSKSPYFLNPTSSMSAATSIITASGAANFGLCPTNYSTTSDWSASDSTLCSAGVASSYNRPPKALWDAKVAACQGGTPTSTYGTG